MIAFTNPWVVGLCAVGIPLVGLAVVAALCALGDSWPEANR